MCCRLGIILGGFDEAHSNFTKKFLKETYSSNICVTVLDCNIFEYRQKQLDLMLNV